MNTLTLDQYDLYILDQWGVMHDGQEGYKLAIQCVEHLYKKNNGNDLS